MTHDLAQALLKQGCRVRVMAAVEGRYVDTQGKLHEHDDQAEVIHMPTFCVTSRFLCWLIFWIQAVLFVPFLRWDRCVLLTDPPFMLIIARVAQWIRRRPVFWWTMDLYPEGLSAGGVIKHDGLIYRLFHRMNEFGMRGLTGVIALGEAQLQRLREYRYLPEDGRVIVVPPWDSRPCPKPDPAQNSFLRQFNPDGKRLAVYAGNLGLAHSFQELIRAAKLMCERGEDDWRFLFIVRGARREELERASNGLPNVRISDYLPHDMTHEMLWGSDSHLITMIPGWEGIVVPSKLYGALQTASPVLFIGPENSDTALEIRKHKAGRVLPSGCSGEEIIAALKEMSESNGRLPAAPLMDCSGKIARFVIGTPLR